MTINNNLSTLFFFLFVTCSACVPLQQQISESDDTKIEGFVGPLVIDKEKFDSIAAPVVYDRLNIDDRLLPANNNATYESTFGGKLVYIGNCKCMQKIEIIQNKLVVTHSYGGGETNRESTMLLWNGKHYQNSKGEYIIDLILHSDKIDIRRAMFTERKVLNVAGVQLKGVNFVWINLLGYDQLIRYSY